MTEGSSEASQSQLEVKRTFRNCKINTYLLNQREKISMTNADLLKAKELKTYQKQHSNKNLEGETKCNTVSAHSQQNPFIQLNFLFHRLLQLSPSILFCPFPFHSKGTSSRAKLSLILFFFFLQKMQCHSSYVLLFKTHILLSLSNHELSSISGLCRSISININNFQRHVLYYRDYRSSVKLVSRV